MAVNKDEKNIYKQKSIYKKIYKALKKRVRGAQVNPASASPVVDTKALDESDVKKQETNDINPPVSANQEDLPKKDLPKKDQGFEDHFFQGEDKPAGSDVVAMDGYLARMAKDILDGKNTSDDNGPTVRGYAAEQAGASWATGLAATAAGAPIHTWHKQHPPDDPKKDFYIKFIQVIKDNYGGESPVAKKVMKPLDHALKLKYLRIKLGDDGFKEVRQAYDDQKDGGKTKDGAKPAAKIKDVLKFAETNFPKITSGKGLVSGFEGVNNRFKDAFNDVKNIKTQPDVFTASTGGDKKSISSSQEPKGAQVSNTNRHTGPVSHHIKTKPAAKTTYFSRFKDFINKSIKFLGKAVGIGNKGGSDISRNLGDSHGAKPIQSTRVLGKTKVAEAAQASIKSASVAPAPTPEKKSRGPKGP
ncbi:MAG: hypothetical protein HON78_02375 [Legionellales bacterium]|jgi:hypothetical protein|nr:hypothetical protein [Legionellales bacterium]